MKRNATLIVLAVVAVALAALVMWDRHQPSTDEAARQKEHLVPNFSRSATTTITIQRGEIVTNLSHHADGWWVTSFRLHTEAVRGVRADDGAVDSLLAVLEYGELERRVPLDDQTRASTGLDHPRVVVRIPGHVLRIGAEAPSRGVYVQRDDDKDAVVAEHRLVETADLDPRLWRSMRLTLGEPADAHAIAFSDWSLVRARGWRVARPVDTRAADAKVDALVQALARARAVRELPPSAEKPTGTPLSLDGVEQARIAGACDVAGETLVARADGARLCFRATDLDLLRAPPATFYERRLFPMRLDDVVAADVGPLSLRRQSAAWRIIAPLSAAGPARDEAVRAWLEPLLAASAASFSSAPVAGGLRVRVATADDDVTAIVGDAHARRAGDTVTLDLAQPLAPSTSAAALAEPHDLSTP